MTILTVRRDTFPAASEASLYRDTTGIRVTLHDPDTFHVEYASVTAVTSDPVAKRILEIQGQKSLAKKTGRRETSNIERRLCPPPSKRV
jgi:hypothetical protein